MNKTTLTPEQANTVAKLARIANGNLILDTPDSHPGTIRVTYASFDGYLITETFGPDGRFIIP